MDDCLPTRTGRELVSGIPFSYSFLGSLSILVEWEREGWRDEFFMRPCVKRELMYGHLVWGGLTGMYWGSVHVGLKAGDVDSELIHWISDLVFCLGSLVRGKIMLLQLYPAMQSNQKHEGCQHAHIHS